jgi:hypothetical protein
MGVWNLFYSSCLGNRLKEGDLEYEPYNDQYVGAECFSSVLLLRGFVVLVTSSISKSLHSSRLSVTCKQGIGMHRPFCA